VKDIVWQAHRIRPARVAAPLLPSTSVHRDTEFMTC
jgi:hypothetical protein